MNLQKSRALAYGTWDISTAIMNTPYYDTATILGFQIKGTIRESASWTKITATIRSQAQEAYYRILALDKRIQYVHEYFFARAWYVSQIYPPPDLCVRQLNTTISWFVWRGDIFRVPLSTLYRPKEYGGWNLTHLYARSHELILYRMRQQVLKSGTITAEWMRSWGLNEQGTNPPLRNNIPAHLEYLRRFAVDSAYVDKQGIMNPSVHTREEYTTPCTT